MSKLTDTQSILLSSASQRDTGSLYPLPEAIKSAANVAKAIAALLKTGLVEEREVSDNSTRYRDDGNITIGVFVTAAGLAAISVADEQAGPGDQSAIPTPEAPAERTTKSASVLTLLQREGGATLAELIEATGWLPHTTRAALTGLRKKGNAIVRGKRDDQTCYSVAATA